MKETETLLTVELQNVLQACEEQGESERADESEEPPSPDLQVPSYNEFIGWAEAAYSSCESTPAELCIRIVGVDEMLALNSTYRGLDKTTNVLSFSADLEPELQQALDIKLLGDVVICHNVVVEEAKNQAKSLHDHYAHLVTHGVLHLCGYDHDNDDEAGVMESLEQKILDAQGITNPYA